MMDSDSVIFTVIVYIVFFHIFLIFRFLFQQTFVRRDPRVLQNVSIPEPYSEKERSKRRALARASLEIQRIVPLSPYWRAVFRREEQTSDSHEETETSEEPQWDVETGEVITVATSAASSFDSASTYMNDRCTEADPLLPPPDNDDDGTSSETRSFSLYSSASFFHRVADINDPRSRECCSICLEPYKVGDSVARVNSRDSSIRRCHHWFHEDCILEWLQNNHKCPLCRTDMIG